MEQEAVQETTQPTLRKYEDVTASTIVTLPEIMSWAPKPLKWTIAGILPEGHSLLSGRPKIGKSRFLHQLLLGVAGGDKALGHLPTRKSDVLLLALEEKYHRIQRRTGQMLSNVPTPSNFHMAFHWRALDDGGLDDLEYWMDKHPGCTIGIDTYVAIAPTPTAEKRSTLYREDYEAVSQLTKLVSDRPGTTLITVMHNRKMGSENPWDIISGSTGIAGAVDGALILYKPRLSTNGLTLFVDGRDIPEQQHHPLTVNERGLFEIGKEAYQIYLTHNQRDIYDVIRQSATGISAKDIAAKLGRDVGNTRKALQKMVKQGKVSPLPGYLYTTVEVVEKSLGNPDEQTEDEE